MAFWVGEHEDSRFILLQRMYTVVGTPIWNVKSSLYTLYSIFIITCVCINLVFMILGIVKNLDDMEFVLDCVRPTFPMINVLWTRFFLRRRMAGLRTLMAMSKDFTWSDLPEKDPDTESYTMSGLIPRIQKFVWRGSNMVLVFHTLYLTLRIVTGNENMLFFNAWFPFDISYLPYHVAVLIFQGFASMMLANLLLGFIGLFAVMVAVGCTQLEKLHSKIMSIKQREGSSSCELKSQLAEFVVQHQTVLKYLNELEYTFNLVLLGPLLSVAATLCFAAFTAITLSGNLVEIIQVSLVVFTFIMQVQTICFFGTELTTRSGKLREAVWCSDWVGTPVSYQKSLLFIMARSSEFVLTAGKTIPISRKTMMTVLNETYTYLMFLLNVSDGKK